MLPQINTFPRFWSKVAIGAPDECWPWLGYIQPNGYARFRLNGRMVAAHRVAYELLLGPIPEGLHIDHLCRVRHCENPYHMEPVTQGVNTLRGYGLFAINARKTHCVRGHPFDETNTFISQGGRQCRQCSRMRNSIRYYKKTGRYVSI